MNKIFTLLNLILLLAFIFSVVVQYNDPDPVQWMAIYGAAAISCGLYWKGYNFTILFIGVGLIALGWAATLAPAVLGNVRFGELFQAFEMKDARIEVGREFGGLVIVAVWMFILAVASWQRKNSQ